MSVVSEVVRPLWWGVVIFVTFFAGLFAFGWWYDDWMGYTGRYQVSDGVCNIAVIPAYGEITSAESGGYDDGTSVSMTTNFDSFSAALRAAEKDPLIKGVLIPIDSYGGSPYGGSAIANAIKRSSLPSAAVIRDAGASAGYWIATGADTVIASSISDVGSIGVTQSYLEYAQQNADSGLEYIEITSAPFKDAGSPDRFLTEEEQERLQSGVDELHDVFVRAVAENRSMPVETVATLADGGTMLGAAALEAGLIDELGDEETARQWFATQLGLPVEKVEFCTSM